MFENAMDRDSAVKAAKLIQALEMGTYTFGMVVRELMIQKTVITHSSGMKVGICDMWYEHLTLKEASFPWLRTDFFPLSSDTMMVFGISEEWKAASNEPTRQVVFMLAKDQSVVAYDRGVMFFMSPTFQDFWTACILFEYDNAVFPSAVRKHVRQMYCDLPGFISFYNKLRLQRVIMESKENRRRSGRTLPLKRNRLMRMLFTAAIAIAHGDIPPLFSDRTILHNNVDRDFLEIYWRKRRAAGRSPETSIENDLSCAEDLGSFQQSSSAVDAVGDLRASSETGPVVTIPGGDESQVVQSPDFQVSSTHTTSPQSFPSLVNVLPPALASLTYFLASSPSSSPPLPEIFTSSRSRSLGPRSSCSVCRESSDSPALSHIPYAASPAYGVPYVYAPSSHAVSPVYAPSPVYATSSTCVSATQPQSVVQTCSLQEVSCSSSASQTPVYNRSPDMEASSFGEFGFDSLPITEAPFSLSSQWSSRSPVRPPKTPRMSWSPRLFQAEQPQSPKRSPSDQSTL
ncbi:E38 [Murid betaherpesvirus 8]|uniref:E38 n=2 Tax=Rat cytomegalovirus (isolate England) TaxID=1261657 RepID=K7YA04_RCMVE|nr:E38 [Murid betaherpesvirus 8]AFX83359.1 E38 [Murid betaherpesvirus 8]WEG71831.1 protein UL38 [Murid betaherpesvirus 8]WPH25221.1 protein UL38 [Murid betaherpesvirus 8]WPH25354.1 protein UL38 [Murid betaherpesvirus 8]